jgi:chaperonin GroEL
MVELRKEQLKARLKESKEEFEKDLLTKRIAKLSNGVVIINVGAKTILEMREKKYRIEDAVNATKAAREEGIVAGGERALIEASTVLQDGLLKGCLFDPCIKLLENAGLESDGSSYPLGIDVTDGHLKNLLEAGIVDPAKVTISALKNASSIACEVLIAQVVIVDEVEK